MMMYVYMYVMYRIYVMYIRKNIKEMLYISMRLCVSCGYVSSSHVQVHNILALYIYSSSHVQVHNILAL